MSIDPPRPSPRRWLRSKVASASCSPSVSLKCGTRGEVHGISLLLSRLSPSERIPLDGIGSREKVGTSIVADGRGCPSNADSFVHTVVISYLMSRGLTSPVVDLANYYESADLHQYHVLVAHCPGAVLSATETWGCQVSAQRLIRGMRGTAADPVPALN